MKKLSLILFTILSQAAVGAFWIIMIVQIYKGTGNLFPFALIVTNVIMIVSLIIALGHLGSPSIAFRAITNIRNSWLSREVFLASLFAALCAVFTYLQHTQMGSGNLHIGIALVAIFVGFLFIYSMGKLYMLKTVLWWNSILTPLSFFLTAIILGGLLINFTLMMDASIGKTTASSYSIGVIPLMTGSIVLLLGLELLLVPTRMTRLLSGSNIQKGQVQAFMSQYKHLYYLRLIVVLIGFIWLGIMLLTQNFNFGFYIVPFGLVILTELLGRYLFYAEQETSAL
jgi:anaerobic dimethyl sulfoxide reductase subunit C